MIFEEKKSIKVQFINLSFCGSCFLMLHVRDVCLSKKKREMFAYPKPQGFSPEFSSGSFMLLVLHLHL